uniref:Reverse transcriptase domain-containing protein n=1 Tax=Tanacetum cinerariifolium TaxID=118510 RepID=A0A6L2NIY8_TANCI|nr:reverse transcriptase domain-containing protein [Tanacetum cinerariifolium]
MFLEKYFPPSMVTKLRNKITNFRQHPDESLFEAWEHYKISIDHCPNHNMLPVTQIDTFYNGLTLRHRETINAVAGETFMKRRPEECYDLIKNMTAHHNDWDTSAQRSESSSSITSSSDPEIIALKTEMAKINKNLMKVLQINHQVKAVTPSCETCGGPHSYNDCPTTVGQTQNIYAARAYQGGNSYQPQGRNQFFQGASHGKNPPPAYQASSYQARVHQPLIPQPQVVTTNEFTKYMKAKDVILKNMHTNMTSLTNSNLELKNMFGQFMEMNTASSSGLGTLPSNTITNPKEDLKVERKTVVTKDTVPPTNNGSTKYVQPLVVQIETPLPNYKPVVAPVIEPVVTPVSALKPNQKPSIPYPFADALILMPKFGPTIKNLLTNKDKMYELARTPLNEHCSSVLLKKLPEKLGDPGKFFISCDFSGMDECLAMADLGASINLMPLSVWNKLSLFELTPTLMTLELADRSISRPIGVAEDVFVKVGKFHFPADFVVVNFDADPRVPLILERSFLKTIKALIDVYEGELTLRIGKEAITLNLDQTLRYSANYNDMTANRIDVIDMACEEYSKEVLGFFNVIASGNPTPYYDPIVSASSPTLTPFGDSDFLLEEVDAFLALEDDPTSLEVYHSYFDMEGDILFFEAFLNDDPSLPPPTQGMYLPQVQKELKICEAKNNKSSIDEPPAVELKDLPPHFEYAFWEGDDKMPVIIAKYLSVKEKAALIKVLKSHKQAIAWKLFDIKGNKYCCFLDGFLGYFQIPIDPKDQEKTTFMCPYGTFAYRHMPFGLCNEPGTFQSHKIFKNRIEVDKDKVDVITKLPHPTTVKGICSFLGHTGFYRRFIQDFSKIALPMTHLLKKDTPFFFSNECIKAFKTLKRKLTKAPILVALDWDLPFELMCDANDFAIDAKPRLLRWVLLLQEFDITVRDKKGAENLAADHLSRLENPHQSVLDKKEINETFPLETLNMVFVRGDSNTLWFADFANYHAGNFVIKGKSSQQKNKFFKDVKHYFWDDPFLFKIWPYPSSRENKYIVVAVDYLSKWVEAKALPTNDARVVCKFLKSLFARFGTPRAIISNHGTHFCNDRFEKVMLSENRASWSDKLDDALWAFYTAFKTPVGCTSYKLVYGEACHLPIELEHKAYCALKHANFDLQTAGDHQKV